MRLRLFILIVLVQGLTFAYASGTYAADNEITNPPIPPKRPSVLRASKAYIDELRARVENPDKIEMPVIDNSIKEDPLSEIYSSPDPSHQPASLIPEGEQIEVKSEQRLIPEPPPQVQSETLQAVDNFDGDELAMSIKNPSRQEVLQALDSSETIEEKATSVSVAKIVSAALPVKVTPPIPGRKPSQESENARLTPISDLEPASGDSTDETEQPLKIETSKLISFYMQPEQIKFDDNLSSFLQNHALRLMREDNDLDIEIRAYATKINNEEHSDVRISLARALEVRTFLMNNRIDPSRLKLKPLYGYDNKDADDRIDLMFVKRP